MLDVYASRAVERLGFMRDRDDQIDAMYTSLFRELLTYMMEDPRNITPCTHLLFCAKNIERIGDHATNIAETVYYIVTGKQMPPERPKEDKSHAVMVGTAPQRLSSSSSATQNALGCPIGTCRAERSKWDHARNIAAAVDSKTAVVASSVYSGGQRVADIAHRARPATWSRQGAAMSSGSACWEPEPRPACTGCRRSSTCTTSPSRTPSIPHQRPKLEQYGDALFIVARTAQLIDGRVSFGETHLFVGKGYIVSVRHGTSTSYATVRQHWETCPTALAKGEDFILYAILDFIVDNYMPVLEQIQEEVDEIEDRVLARPMTGADIERLYMLRRDLLRLRNAADPLVEVCRRLTGTDLPQIRPAMHQSVPRRDGPHPHGAGEDRQSARGAGLRLRGEPAGRPEPGDGDRQEAGFLGGDPRRADGGRRHLRHEFRPYAGTRRSRIGYPAVLWLHLGRSARFSYWRFKPQQTGCDRSSTGNSD